MFGILNDLYGRSPNWRRVRAEHLKYNPSCAACGRKNGLEVHHIIPYNVHPELELDPNNLITLCDKYCHFVFGHLMDWKSWNTNVQIDCKEYYNKKQSRSHLEKFGSSQKGYSHAIFTIIYDCYIWIIKHFCWNN
jgi:hypothetical protein